MNRTHMYEFMSEDYQNGWNDGYEAHRQNQQYPSERVRTDAFGAIRRAAEVARSIDANREEHRKANNWIDFVHCEWRAYSVRRAIRAAIGSDKA